MMDDDDYPPYPPLTEADWTEIRGRQSREVPFDYWRYLGPVIIAGLVAGVAIGGLLVAYGVF